VGGVATTEVDHVVLVRHEILGVPLSSPSTSYVRLRTRRSVKRFERALLRLVTQASGWDNHKRRRARLLRAPKEPKLPDVGDVVGDFEVTAIYKPEGKSQRFVLRCKACECERQLRTLQIEYIMCGTDPWPRCRHRDAGAATGGG
jgi:hypothetical protein